MSSHDQNSFPGQSICNEIHLSRQPKLKLYREEPLDPSPPPPMEGGQAPNPHMDSPFKLICCLLLKFFFSPSKFALNFQKTLILVPSSILTFQKWNVKKCQLYDYENKANLFRWVISVILFTPKLCIHLQPDIIKVNIPGNLFHVPLCNIISCMLPVHVL